MSGTKAGGMKAAATIKAKNPHFYSEIGVIGGRNSKTGGFAARRPGKDGLTGPERARIVGIIGGRKSRRSKRKAQSCHACLSKDVKLTRGLCGVCEPMDSPELRGVLNMPTYVAVMDEGREEVVEVRRPVAN